MVSLCYDNITQFSDKKINILHLQNHLNTSCGISKTIYLITKNTSLQFQHYVACLDGDSFSRFESINVNPLALKDYHNSLTGFLIHLRKIYLLCKKKNIQIIHSHHRYFDLLAFFLSRLLKIKTITSVQSKVYGKIFLSYRSDILIACSGAVKSHLLSHFKINESKIQVIQNMVDPFEMKITTSTPELLNQLNIPSGINIIVFIGRIDFAEKGVDILLEAFKRILGRPVEVALLFVGSGKDEIQAKHIASSISSRVVFVKAQTNIYKYINLADIIVLPSRIEPFGIVMIESGLAKKPFIGSNVDGIKEYISDGINGLLFKNEEATDLAQKIEYLLKNKEFGSQLGENLFNKVKENNTVQTILPKYERLYQRLCK